MQQESSQKNKSFLIADDEELFRERLAMAIRARGWEVQTAANYVQAMECAERNPPDRALLDLRMPGRSGLTCCVISKLNTLH